MEYIAHINENHQMQTVKDHVCRTAERAKDCLSGCGLSEAAYLAGILHDMGKLTPSFQKYIREPDAFAKGSVIHTFQGCKYLLDIYHKDSPENIFASELLAYAVGAHHGLFDCVDDNGKIGFAYRCEKSDMAYDQALQNFHEEILPQNELDSLYQKAQAELTEIVQKIDTRYVDDAAYAFQIGLTARLILSAVIEGDRADTARFMSGIASESARTETERSAVWRERLAFMEQKLAEFPNHTPINRARSTISDRCKAFAEKPKGIYRMNLPTGAGKTLSSLRFALAHAEKYAMKRIIFTAPLLSILEQNAKVIRDFVGDDSLILEHHSNAVNTSTDAAELDKRELLVQSWEAPIILTSMVQLLNTLFDGKTTSIRRFQALCDSILIIDEVQTVPSKMLSMFNMAIEFLAEVCGATVILCSATQPCFEKTLHPLQSVPEDMLEPDGKLMDVFRRNEIRSLGQTTLEKLPETVGRLLEHSQNALVICNTKKEAANLYNAMKQTGLKLFHLSANMCMNHRRNEVEKIKNALKQNEKMLCISTQVIEAGVDISFECVLRLSAGMDNIVQAAGRCNRNGEAKELRPVYTINCTDERLGNLPDIRRAKDATQDLLYHYAQNPDSFQNALDSDRSIHYYYESLFGAMNGDLQDYPVKTPRLTLFDILSINQKYADNSCTGVENYALHQAFKTAGRLFKVFEEQTTDILVPYEKGAELITALQNADSLYTDSRMAFLLKQAAGYTVSVYDTELRNLLQMGAIEPICDGAVYALRKEYYDDAFGLTKQAGSLDFMEV